MTNKATVIPTTNKAFYQAHQVEANRRAAISLKSRFGRYMEQAAVASNVPLWFLRSVVMVENLSGNNLAASGGTIGLAQLLPAAAQDVIVQENKAKKLSTAEKIILRRRLGSKLDSILEKQSLGGTLYITAADLTDPELNLQIAAIYISRLIDECTIGGYVRYEQVIVGYNLGYFSKVRSQIKNMTIDAVIAAVRPTTAAYITKILGVNGHAHTILKNKI
jgi:hypothetical protein